jgi:serine/threonine protein kinase
VEFSKPEYPNDVSRASKSTLPAAVPNIPGYRITAEIARGGMGRVYAAFDETLEREVAIKTLLPGADAERFVIEAKITARLPHPGIPPVYALGTLPDGTPWLAMKLIRGQTLASLLPSPDRGATDKLSRDPRNADNPSRDRQGAGNRGAGNRRADALRSPSNQSNQKESGEHELPGLGLPQLIQIFEQIAQAVGFAHSRGIIHRDLKPLNVMVGEFGEVQVMDWGLAKDLSLGQGDDPNRDRQGADNRRADALRSPSDQEASGQIDLLGEAPEHTAAGTILGTPGYMAPEQARAEVVDQRADVFALGSILATILTGEPAFVGSSMLETIEKSACADLTEVMARLDQCSADEELIALSKRCLQANPEDRPADACEVAAAVAAYRASVEQRLRQAETDRAKAETRAVEQAKRRRIVQWASGAIAAALLAGLGVSLWQMNRAITAERQTAEERDAKAKALEAETLAKQQAETRRQEAEAARQESQKRLAQIEKSNEIITSIFTDLDMRKVNQGQEPLEAVLAERLVKAAGQLEGEAVGDPLMMAQLQDRLGQSLLSLGHASEAVELFAKAHATRASRLGPDHPDTLTSMNNLALGYQAAGRLDLALPLLEKTLKLTSAKLGPDHPDTLTCMNNLARGYWATGKLDLALPLWEETLKLMIENLGEDHPHTLTIMANLAAGYQATGKLDLALPLYEETLKLMKAELGADHPDTLASMSNLAAGYLAAGKLDLALPLLEETLKLTRAKLGADHPHTLASMNKLALAYQAAKRLDLALPLLEETLKLMRAKLGADHPDTLTIMNNLAASYRAAGKLDLALPLLEETLRLLRVKLGPDHPYVLLSMGNLALGYQSAGKLDLALPLLEEALELTRAKLGPNHPDTLTCMNNLAANYQAAGKLDFALALWEETLKLMKSKLGPNHPDTLTCMNNLALGYQAAGRMDLALPLLEQATMGIEKRQFQDEHAERIVPNFIRALEDAHDLAKAEAWQRKWLAVVKERSGVESVAFAGELATLGLNLLRQRKYTEAEPLLRECLAIREKMQPDDWNTFNTVFLLGEALLGQEKYAEAEPLLVRGYEGMKARETTMPEEIRQSRLNEALDRLIELYTAVNKPDEANKYRDLRSNSPTPTVVPG